MDRNNSMGKSVYKGIIIIYRYVGKLQTPLETERGEEDR